MPSCPAWNTPEMPATAEGQDFSETVVAQNLGQRRFAFRFRRLRGGGAAGRGRHTLVSAGARRPTGRAQ